MKYKIGDKVRIRQYNALKRLAGQAKGDLLYYREYEYPFNFESMSKYCGKVSKIVNIHEQSNSYQLDIDDGHFYWQDWMFEGYAFEYGDWAEFSDYRTNWTKGIYAGYIDGDYHPYAAVVPESQTKNFKKGNNFNIILYRYARPIQKKHIIIIDDKEIEISEESYQNLKKSLLEKD